MGLYVYEFITMTINYDNVSAKITETLSFDEECFYPSRDGSEPNRG